MTDQDFASFCYYIGCLRGIMHKITCESDAAKAVEDLEKHGIDINDYMNLKTALTIVFQSCYKLPK